MDTETGDIRAVEVISSRHGDSPLLPDLLSHIPEDGEIATVTAEGASGTRRCHTAIIEHGADAVIPIRRNGRAWKEDRPAALAQNEILRATRRPGRALWKTWADHHVRSRVEAQMNRLKLFGERIMPFAIVARTNGAKWLTPNRQTAGIQTRIAIMNRFSSLGRAKTEALA